MAIVVQANSCRLCASWYPFAICVPKSLQRQFDVQATEEVTFVQLSAEAYQYRDAVRFRNGSEVLLQCLRCGQHVEVLSLCSGESREEEHQRREEEYRRIFVV